MTDPPNVQIPSNAVSAEGDLRQPVRSLLEDLNLLGTAQENQQAEGFSSAFTGPPQSVALIEAGATAAAKWWAAGLSALVIPIWGAVAAWWPKQKIPIEVTVLAAAAVVTTALVLSIGYLIASDVRGRAAASVSLVQARAKLAARMIQAAEAVYEPRPAGSVPDIVPLPSAIRAKNLGRPAADEDGWLAVAMERHSDGNIKYIVVKGSSEESVPASGLEF
jgi:hypothetical protein